MSNIINSSRMAFDGLRKRLNNSSILKQDDYFPSTYIVLQFANNVHIEAVQWIIFKIESERKDGGAELLVRKQPEVPGEKSLIFHVSATNQKLLELAEEQSIRKKDLKGSLRDFTVVEQSEFGGGSDILSTAEKEYLVRHELENIRALENEKAIPGYPRILLYEGQSIFAACVHYNLLQQLFPLHDEDVLRKLGHKWYLSLFKKQPFEEIREYFGESIALYFQFLGYYTYALIVPMVLGFLQLCLAPENIALFCIINVLWASVFMELWRMKCSELAFVWGTIGMASSLDEPRPNYNGVMGVDHVTGRLQPQCPRWKTQLKMYTVSIPLVILCMILAFFVMLISFWVEEQLRGSPDCPQWLYLAPSVAYAALIYLMNMVYRRFANNLTEWENHRTQSQFDRHRVTKLVLFEFVNNFMSLFYIAFIYQDMDMLRSQLATLLIISQAINNFQEALLPLILQYYSSKMAQLKKRNSSKKWQMPSSSVDVQELSGDDPRILQALRESRLDFYEDPYDDYLELFVQFGYVFLFSSVYPMAAFWAVANNLLEIRSDAFKLCCSYQRPMARRVKDTGAWQRAFQALCTLSVITNCGFLYLSPAMRAVAPDASPAEWMMVFVFLEHVLLALRQVLHYAIPDKPEWVRLALARQQFQSKQALKKQRMEKTK
ncbi:anoctamin-10 isoform X2 [Homalodisca vitripennis]|uniref:anoctamin-10 isoform X2 n=1 Tax=Homalodisca vitripennis TaxID=197043 RepID=UPI001EEA3319|nr:anoctamin-10 isoform X2 [Homalodisca vitripennis]